MNILTRESDYAIRALLYIAQQDGAIVSSRDLDNELCLPRPFMRRVLQILEQGGILESRKGNKGGFRLLKDPCDIRLSDVMTLYQGPFTATECLFRKKICKNIAGCPLRKRLKKIESHIKEEIENITMADLLKGTR